MNFWIRTTMDWMFCSITWWLPLKWCGKRSRTRWLSLISSSINTNGFHVFFSSEIDGSNDLNASLNTSHNRSSPLNLSKNGNHQYSDETSAFKRFTLGRTDNKRLHRKIKKYHLGEATDDVRLCIMCLRAIMNNQVQTSEKPTHDSYHSEWTGNPASYLIMTFSLALSEWLQSRHSTSICLELYHTWFAAQELSVGKRTSEHARPAVFLTGRCKALILELLAAVCLVELGHDVVLAAFDHFRIVSSSAAINFERIDLVV